MAMALCEHGNVYPSCVPCLQEENCRLRDQLAEAQKKRDRWFERWGEEQERANAAIERANLWAEGGSCMEHSRRDPNCTNCWLLEAVAQRRHAEQVEAELAVAVEALDEIAWPLTREPGCAGGVVRRKTDQDCCLIAAGVLEKGLLKRHLSEGAVQRARELLQAEAEVERQVATIAALEIVAMQNGYCRLCHDRMGTRRGKHELTCPLADLPAAAKEHMERVIRDFVDRVNRRAEAEMERTGTLEGAHHRAIQAELAALES